jgi:hypothetical protein
LKIFYEEFHEGNHMVCHKALHQRGLLSRLHQARDVVRSAEDDPLLKEKLAEAMAVNSADDTVDRWQLATDELARLQRGLTGIRQRADAVDARIASFLLLSHQRFHYQSQMRGRRPEMARRLCETINQQYAEQRFANLDRERFDELIKPWRGLLAVEAEVLHGVASLRMPRRSRQPVSLALSDASLGQPDEAERERLREQLRAALTPGRAGRIVTRLLPETGSSVSTANLTLREDDDLLDLMAAAAFNHALVSGALIRWRADSQRQADDFERKNVPRDDLSKWRVERFTLTRTK